MSCTICMTIRGFWQLVDEQLGRLPEATERIDFGNYAFRFAIEHNRFLIVGIDSSQWIMEAISRCKAFGNSEKHGFVEKVEEYIYSKIKYLKGLKVNFVFVFDGKFKYRKHGRSYTSGCGFDRSDIFENDYEHLLDLISKGEHVIRNDVYVQSIVALLKRLYVSYIFAPGDAEIELARLSNAGIIDAVISNDADGFAYGCQVILRNFSRYLENKPASAAVNLPKSATTYYITPTTMASLEKIGLSQDEIMFFSCMSGNDYSKGISQLGPKKAWLLATNKSFAFDCVQQLKNIYVSNNFDEYLLGKIPYSHKTRKSHLAIYEKLLVSFINSNSKTLFGRNYHLDMKDIELDDYILGMHYYPLCCKYLFQFSASHFNYCTFPLQQSTSRLWLPRFPQRLSVVSVNGLRYTLLRGNDYEGTNTNTTTFYDRTSLSNDLLASNSSYIQFLNQVGETIGSTKELELYLWDLFYYCDFIKYCDMECFIKTKKSQSITFGGFQYSFSIYTIVLKEAFLVKKLGKFPNIKDYGKQSRSHHLKVPDFLITKTPNGRMMIAEFEKGEKMQNTRLSRSKSVSPQKTTLDQLLKTPVSRSKRRRSTDSVQSNLDVSLVTPGTIFPPIEFLSPSAVKLSPLSAKSLNHVKPLSRSNSICEKNETFAPYILNIDAAELHEENDIISTSDSPNVSRQLCFDSDSASDDHSIPYQSYGSKIKTSTRKNKILKRADTISENLPKLGPPEAIAENGFKFRTCDLYHEELAADNLRKDDITGEDSFSSISSQLFEEIARNAFSRTHYDKSSVLVPQDTAFLEPLKGGAEKRSIFKTPGNIVEMKTHEMKSMPEREGNMLLGNKLVHDMKRNLNDAAFTGGSKRSKIYSFEEHTKNVRKLAEETDDEFVFVSDSSYAEHL